MTYREIMQEAIRVEESNDLDELKVAADKMTQFKADGGLLDQHDLKVSDFLGLEQAIDRRIYFLTDPEPVQQVHDSYLAECEDEGIY